MAGKSRLPRCERHGRVAATPPSRGQVASDEARSRRGARKADPAAAIAGESAAHVYGMRIVAGPIEDRPDNATRFLVPGRALFPPSGNDRTSPLVFVRDQPGALYRVLEPLERHGVSMNRVESRPAHTSKWQHAFFIDAGGHVDEPPLRDARAELRDFAVQVTVLGSYPIAVA